MKDKFLNTGVAVLVVLPILCMSGLMLNYFAILPPGISQLWFVVPMAMEAVLVISLFTAISILTGK